MLHLARWLTKHLENPTLLLWVANQGGTLHSHFARLIWDELTAKPLSPAMQTLWQLVLGGRVRA
jgi:hypothetical protein